MAPPSLTSLTLPGYHDVTGDGVPRSSAELAVVSPGENTPEMYLDTCKVISVPTQHTPDAY